MRRVRLLEEAAQEALEAAAWYEQQRVGLGRELSEAIESVLDMLEDDIVPLTPVPGAAGVQGAMRVILKRFPYDVVVQQRSEEILVVAVTHHSRRPGYWRNRKRT